jgi:hypothetical protein
MGLMEWSFVTATTDGHIVSLDGRIPQHPLTVRDLCTGDGWDVEHATITDHPDAPTYWRLILSRPLQPMMPTRGHLDDSVIVGIASSGERMLHEAL